MWCTLGRSSRLGCAAVNDLTQDSYHRGNNFTKLGGWYNYSALPNYVKFQSVVVTPARLALMDLIDTVRRCCGTAVVVTIGRLAGKRVCGRVFVAGVPRGSAADPATTF